MTNLPSENLYSLEEMKMLNFLAVDQRGMLLELMIKNTGLYQARVVHNFAGANNKLVLKIGT